MDQNRLPFAEKDIKKVLESAEGQKLIQILNRDGGNALRQAAAALQRGDLESAKQVLSPVMESEEASQLVDKLNRR